MSAVALMILLGGIIRLIQLFHNPKFDQHYSIPLYLSFPHPMFSLQSQIRALSLPPPPLIANFFDHPF
jgi:hypothetical protein